MTTPIVWSGNTTSYHHKWNSTPNPPEVKQALRQVWFLDVQWSTCPEEVEKEVIQLWIGRELGNDNYIVRMAIDEEAEVHYPAIYQYVLECNPNLKDETVIIHWWW